MLDKVPYNPPLRPSGLRDLQPEPVKPASIRHITMHCVYGYAITPSVYAKVLDTETCDICGKKARVCLDHDHKTGALRGALCFRCNSRILASANDNIDLLLNAVMYLLDPPATRRLGLTMLGLPCRSTTNRKSRMKKAAIVSPRTKESYNEDMRLRRDGIRNQLLSMAARLKHIEAEPEPETKISGLLEQVIDEILFRRKFRPAKLLVPRKKNKLPKPKKDFTCPSLP